ncbi:short-chain dehydrogenase [Virgisporangium aliadipatigenens]|uniref:Short-chain dehydrogenase n=1 Tax=Virgisporangium aliadipatigenens TaxID=741659 RepID=A0A8J4DR61_9ACTN|nr:SDR family NAD(P)-dependent oxidoreductase [Virgisporangium aliadipatigenens]GIJ46736.1 short-chain dehydrogenase [Virgisporangium aliadipatigenens]
MARVLVTGSADGIGRETAAQLIALGHEVVGHARNESRADDLRAALPGIGPVVTGELASLAGTTALAEAAVKAGGYDVVIHNAGISGRPARHLTVDGMEQIFQVNVVAPYLLTALLPRPARLVYLTSGLESDGVVDLDDMQFARKPWHGMRAYSDSKMYDVVLAFAVARRWPEVITNVVDPGWIKTRLGGPGATDELPEGAETQVWLATSDDPEAVRTGRYLKRRRVLEPNPAAREHAIQDALLAECERLTGVALPT